MGLGARARGLDRARVAQGVAIAELHGRGILARGAQRVIAAVVDGVVVAEHKGAALGADDGTAERQCVPVAGPDARRAGA